MSRARHVTPEEVARIVELREQQQMPWFDIASVMRRSENLCRMRYYTERNARREAKAKAEAKAAIARKYQGLMAVPAIAPAPVPRSAPRMASLDGLRDRAELAARIAERGLTGGMFGDPPPGRSALDQRASVAAPALKQHEDHHG